MAIYGYARCSTNETKQDVNRQIRDLKALGVDNVNNIYKEYESGSKTDRMELNKLLSIVVEGDTIIATEVSRITRSTKQLCDIIELAKEKKLKLILGSFILDCSADELDPMAKAMLSMMGVFSELEKDMISQRVKSGMANAKAKGKVIGRPKATIEDVPQVVLKAYELLKVNKINKTECAKMCSITRPTLDKYIKIIKEVA